MNVVKDFVKVKSVVGFYDIVTAKFSYLQIDFDSKVYMLENNTFCF